ncbi:unnamed protein product, partial [Effrenium voratum]
MNSGLQCLANIPLLRDRLEASSAPSALQKALGALVQQLWDARSTVVNPGTWRDALNSATDMFAEWQQHDSMEFVEFLVDRLTDEWKAEAEAEGAKAEGGAEAAEKETEAAAFGLSAHRLFAGSLETFIRCPHEDCAKEWSNMEKIISIKLPGRSFELSQKEELTIILVPRPSSQQPPQALRLFLSRPALAGQLAPEAAASHAEAGPGGVCGERCVAAAMQSGCLWALAEDEELEHISAQLFVYELEDCEAVATFHQARGQSNQEGPLPGERRLLREGKDSK